MKTGKRAFAALSVLLLGVSLAGASGTAAIAATTVDETYVGDDGIVHYAYDPADRPGAILRSEAGVARDGGCAFIGQGSAPGADETLLVVDEVLYDPSTCTRTVSVAKYESGNVPAVVLKGIASNLETTSTQRTGGSALLATSWTKKLTIWVADLVGIHVSETSTKRTWNSSGGYSGIHTRGTYTPTGWTITKYTPIDTSTYSDTIAQFQNVAFCNPVAATYSNHNKTRIVTNTGGGSTWSYSMYKWGDCAELLSYHYVVG